MFDGVHKGHRRVIGRLVKLAAEKRAESTVITFDYIPKNHYGVLTSPAERTMLLKDAGVDRVLVLPFKNVSDMGADEFISKYLKGYCGAVVGYDFRFI